MLSACANYSSFGSEVIPCRGDSATSERQAENFPHVNDYRNPIIVEALKNLGYVNMFNRGVSRVKELFKENGNPPIDFDVDKIMVFEVVVKPNVSATSSSINIGKATNRGRKKMVPSKTELDKLLFYCREPRTLTEILNYMGYTNRTKFRNKYVKPLLQEGNC